MKELLQALETQRWDDHRYYHHSRINQTLHFVSAASFLTAYALLFAYPVAAALIGWLVAMTTRQIGHFFFEPRGFDEINGASFDEKERIKIGFNLRRKVILFSSWLLVPLTLALSPSFFGLFASWHDRASYLHSLGVLWLALAGAGLLGRTLFLAVTRSPKTGFVWFTKILTDPFHDVMIYYKSPYWLLKGQMLDPMEHVRVAHE